MLSSLLRVPSVLSHLPHILSLTVAAEWAMLRSAQPQICCAWFWAGSDLWTLIPPAIPVIFYSYRAITLLGRC